MRALSLFIVVLLGIVLFVSDSNADARVPIQLQAQLTARLGTFDRNFPSRAGPVAQVLVVSVPGNAESRFEASNVTRALEDLHQIGGVTAKLEQVDYSGDPAALAARCRAQKIALIYLTIGLEREMPRIGAALDGIDVLTVGSSAQHAENGAVVGFGLEEARPKIVLNLKRAKSQNVNFKAEFLKLARIVE